METELNFLSAGDQSLVIELGKSIDLELNQKIKDLTYSIEQKSILGIIELIPSYRSILIKAYPYLIAIIHQVLNTIRKLTQKDPSFLDQRPELL